MGHKLALLKYLAAIRGITLNALREPILGFPRLLEDARHALVRSPQVVIREVARDECMYHAYRSQRAHGGTPSKHYTHFWT